MKLRQGDVALISISRLPERVKKVSEELKIEGEVTGHEHVLSDIEVFQRGSSVFIKVPETKTMTHPEHPPLQVPPGIYQVIQAREYNNPRPVD
jgi:hypothetical protein